MDETHIVPTDDGFAHVTDGYRKMGCPCDPDECDGAILHRRMDGGEDRVIVVEKEAKR